MEMHHSADYPFLARPPRQKKRAQPLTPAQATCGPRCKPSTSSAIAAWAAHVHPGSPAPISPRSRHRSPSLRRARRSSITASASFLRIAPTPTTAHVATPSMRDFKADLTTVGYTSVFLHLPNTPISATLTFCIEPPSPSAAKKTTVPPRPSPTYKSRSLTRFRSFSVLRSRGRSKSACPDAPTKMKARTDATSAAIVKRKKAKYALPPPPLANELAIMQFTDGGSTDSNIKRVVEAKAKATGAVGLVDVHRDGEGGIWWDQDEQWEYTHLLAEGVESRPHGTGDLQWATFDGDRSPSVAGGPAEDRRGSTSTQDSDLDPKYIVQPVDSLGGDGLRSAVAPHLRKANYVVDAAFPRSHALPKSPKSPKSSTSSGVVAGTMKPRGKARRRPAPLQLSLPSPASRWPTNSPVDMGKDFIDASFEPACSVPVTPATVVSMSTPVDSRVGNSRAINMHSRSVNNGLGARKKPSMLNMMGLFRSVRREDVTC